MSEKKKKKKEKAEKGEKKAKKEKHGKHNSKFKSDEIVADSSDDSSESKIKGNSTKAERKDKKEKKKKKKADAEEGEILDDDEKKKKSKKKKKDKEKKKVPNMSINVDLPFVKDHSFHTRFIICTLGLQPQPADGPMHFTANKEPVAVAEGTEDLPKEIFDFVSIHTVALFTDGNMFSFSFSTAQLFLL